MASSQPTPREDRLKNTSWGLVFQKLVGRGVFHVGDGSGYWMQLKTQQLAPATINVRLAAVRRLVYKAADTGLLSVPRLVAGIRRVKGIPQLCRRVGNWLTASEGEKLLSGFDPLSLRRRIPKSFGTPSVLKRGSTALDPRLLSLPEPCGFGRTKGSSQPQRRSDFSGASR